MTYPIPTSLPYIPAGTPGNPRPATLQPGKPEPVKPATPELDRRHHIIEGDGHRHVVAFLEWLDSEDTDGYRLTRWRQGEATDISASGFERVLAKFYGLDLDKIEAEKMLLLEYMREVNQQ